MPLRSLVLPFAILLVSSLIAQAGADVRPVAAASPANVPRYRIELDVDYAAGTYRAKQSVETTNRTNEAWGEIVLAVTPAKLGTFRLQSAAVQGRSVAGDLTGSVLRLPAAPAVVPGQVVRIELEYEVAVPDIRGRFGYRDGILSLGSFYPVLNVYRQGPLTFAGERAGWTGHQYVDVGDAFFTEASDYEVTVRTAQPVTVAATGGLVGQAGTTWQYRGERLREFALSLSDRFRVESILVGDTVVAAYYLPEHAAAGTKYLHIAREALGWFTDTLGEYPYGQLSIVEMSGDTTENVGQEYPGLIMLSGAVWPQSTDYSDYLTYLLAHEIAHQWFYAVVGNDQVEDPWIDEAMATWLGKHWQLRVASRGRPNLLVDPTRPIDVGIDQFAANGPYFNLIYREGASLIEKIYQVLGERVFFYALRDVTDTFRHQIATPTGFLDLLQSYTPRSLNPIISQHVGNAKYGVAEPPRAGIWTDDTWSGPTRIVLSTLSPLSRVTLYIDHRQIWTGGPIDELTVDPRDLTPGDHLVTAVLEDETGRWVERSRRFTVADPSSATGLPTSAGPIRPVGRTGA